ncbi:transmembrane protease serine 9-like [Paramacrobiotus metropolitanus]|uniref:transmembrane protease serine 9-like n=1 Tax=Paramacrobiotus metropolitanus TaxID=2943436 RepID=UPI002445898F|nr:transmembrane protease serine 9-like [Paramacrobiotus metropolitanus]
MAGITIRIIVIFAIGSVSYGQFWRPIKGKNNQQGKPVTPRPPRTTTGFQRFPCGRPDPTPDSIWTTDSRIVGGVEAPDGGWPFIVALIRNRSDQGYQAYQFCSGSIIATRWILTAGHCVAALTERQIVDDVLVVAGVNNLQDVVADPELALRIARVFKHEEYDDPQNSYNNDIAMLQLAKPLKFDQYTQPICLPATHPDNRTRWGNVDKARGNKRVVFAAGWGVLKEHQDSDDPSRMGAGTDQLQQVAIDLYDNSECKRRLSNYVFTEKMICCGIPEGGKDACQGDSGGPLVAKDLDGRFEQIGIVSWGSGCARANSPGIYTNVFAFKDWIGTTIITN